MKGAVTGGWLILPFINTFLVQTPKRLKVSLLIYTALNSPFKKRSHPTLPTIKKGIGKTQPLSALSSR